MFNKIAFLIGSIANGFGGLNFGIRHGFFDNFWWGILSCIALMILSVLGGASALLIYEKWKSKISQQS